VSNLRRITLWFLLLTLAAWGLVLLIYPQFVWETLHGADAVSSAYSRYGGAWFLGVAVAAGVALTERMSDRPVYVVALVGGALSFIVLLADTLTDNLPGSNDWIVWAAIVDAGLTALLCALALNSRDTQPV
jgi:hypothetical protein